MTASEKTISSYFIEQFKSHPVHNLLNTFTKEVKSKEPENLDETSIAISATYFKLIQTLTWVQSIFSGTTEAIFVTKLTLDNIVQCLNNLRAEYSNFSNDHARWSVLDQNINNLIQNMRFLSQGDLDTSTLSSLFEEYYQKVVALKRYATNTENNLESVNKKLGVFSQEIDNQKTLINKTTTEHTEIFNKAQSQRAKELDDFAVLSRKQIQEAIQKIENDNITIHETLKTDFEKNQEILSSQFDESQEKFETEFRELFEANNEKLNNLFQNQEGSSKKLIEDIRNKLKEANEVVGTIVTTTMTGNYQKIAQREYMSAWIMRVLAFVFFGGMGIVLYQLVNNLAQNGDIDWKISILRFALGAILAVPATYCMKESSRHWEFEKNYRRKALELSAIEPYLDRINSPAVKKKILEETASAYFGAGRADIASSGKDELQNTSLSLRSLIELMRELASSLTKKD